MPAYEDFAQVYDALMDDVDYDAWAAYYLKLIHRAEVTPRTLCDCACGTGSLSVRFAAQDIRVTGCDLSAQMLARAQGKARQAGVRAMFVQQDMRALELPRPVDALVCGCDGVNYLLDDASLQAFFTAAHRNIKSGGVLAFDVSSPYKIAHVLGNGFFGEERDDVAYLWSNAYDPVSRIVDMDLTFFVRQSGDTYRRFCENHRQKAHEPDELVHMLARCGFDGIEIFGDRTFESPGDEEARIHILARNL